MHRYLFVWLHMQVIQFNEIMTNTEMYWIVCFNLLEVGTANKNDNSDLDFCWN